MSAKQPIETIIARCLICGKEGAFDSWESLDFPCKRNSFFCRYCGSIARNRHIAKVVLELSGEGEENLKHFATNTPLSIWHTCASGALHETLRGATNYTVSEYYDGLTSGENLNGIPCQNLETTSFPDNCFDLIITEEVMEHVAQPKKALKELRRVLKPGGYLVSTIPVLWWEKKSKIRAVLQNKQVEYLEEPAYHFDPNRQEGVLVYTDFGADIVERYLSLTGITKVYSSHNNPSDEQTFAIYNNWVFVSRKEAQKRGFLANAWLSCRRVL